MPHVLVVDDDRATVRLLQKELTAHGFEVSSAVDGLDALMKLESILPDVILCDLNMPKLDGMALARAVKDNAGTRAIPILFLTAESDPRRIIDCINVGARFYITKPFDMKELVWKLKRVVGGVVEREAGARAR